MASVANKIKLGRGVANLIGASTMAVAESLVNAEDAYDERIKKGDTHRQAQKIASATFGLNLPLAAVTNHLARWMDLIFPEKIVTKSVTAAVRRSKAKRLTGFLKKNAARFITKNITPAVPETIQEATQEIIPAYVSGEPIPWGRAAHVGAITFPMTIFMGHMFMAAQDTYGPEILDNPEELNLNLLRREEMGPSLEKVGIKTKDIDNLGSIVGKIVSGARVTPDEIGTLAKIANLEPISGETQGELGIRAMGAVNRMFENAIDVMRAENESGVQAGVATERELKPIQTEVTPGEAAQSPAGAEATYVAGEAAALPAQQAKATVEGKQLTPEDVSGKPAMQGPPVVGVEQKTTIAPPTIEKRGKADEARKIAGPPEQVKIEREVLEKAEGSEPYTVVAGPAISKIKDAYEEIVKQRSSSYVPIADIVAASGVGQEVVHNFLREHAKEGHVALSTSVVKGTKAQGNITEPMVAAGVETNRTDPDTGKPLIYTTASIKPEAFREQARADYSMIPGKPEDIYQRAEAVTSPTNIPPPIQSPSGSPQSTYGIAMELPEIYDFFQDLSGGKKVGITLKNIAPSKVKYFDKYFGKVTPGGITVRSDVAQIPGLAEIVLSHEIGHWIDRLDPRQRTGILGQIADVHDALFNPGRRLVKKKDIRRELLKVTDRLYPLDQTAIDPEELAKRRQNKELFADGFTMFLFDPTELNRLAPKFYQSMLKILEEKDGGMPLTAYANIQNRLLDPVRVQEERLRRIEEGYARGEERYLEKTRLEVETLGEFFDDVLTYMFDSQWDILGKRRKYIKKRKKQLQLIDQGKKPTSRILLAKDDPIYPLLQMSYQTSIKKAFTDEFYHRVIRGIRTGEGETGPKLSKLTHQQLGWLAQYLQLQRTMHEPNVISGSHTYKTAEATMQHLAKKIGRDNFKRIADASHDIWYVWKKHIIPMMKYSGGYSQDLLDRVDKNAHYVKFRSIQHIIEGHSGGKMTARAVGNIFGRKGTFDQYANPIGETLLEGLRLINAALRTSAMRKTVRMLEGMQDPNLGEKFVERAERIGMKWKPPANSRLVLITFLDKGKVAGYYVPQRTARIFEHDPQAALSWAAKGARITTFPFRKLFVDWNPGFWAHNFGRDMQAAIVQADGLFRPFLMPYYILKNLPTSALKATLDSIDVPAWDAHANTALKMAAIPSITSRYGDRDVKSATDRVLTRYGSSPAMRGQWRILNHPKSGIARAFKIFDEIVSSPGMLFERATKLAALDYHLALRDSLEKKFAEATDPRRRERLRNRLSGLSLPEIARIVQRSGTPSILRTGLAVQIYNNLFLYSSVREKFYQGEAEAIAKQGLAQYAFKRGAIMLPRWLLTVGGGLWAAEKLLYYLGKWFFPNLMDWSRRVGLMGDEMKNFYRKVAPYHKDNYTIVPLGYAKNDYAVYLTLPMDDGSRLTGYPIFKMLDYATNDGQNIDPSMLWHMIGYLEAELPSLSPPLEIGGAVKNLLTTEMSKRGEPVINTYDTFYKRYFVDPRLAATGPENPQVAREYLKQIWNKSGLNVLYNFPSYDQIDVQMELDKSINIPVLFDIANKFKDSGIVELGQERLFWSRFLGRFVRINKTSEEKRLLVGEVSQDEAMRSRMARDKIVDFVDNFKEEFATDSFDSNKSAIRRYAMDLRKQMIDQELIDPKHNTPKVFYFRILNEAGKLPTSVNEWTRGVASLSTTRAVEEYIAQIPDEYLAETLSQIRQYHLTSDKELRRLRYKNRDRLK